MGGAFFLYTITTLHAARVIRLLLLPRDGTPHIRTRYAMYRHTDLLKLQRKKESGARFRLFWLTWLRATWAAWPQGVLHRVRYTMDQNLVSSCTDATSITGHVLMKVWAHTFSLPQLPESCRGQPGRALELRCPGQADHVFGGWYDAFGGLRHH